MYGFMTVAFKRGASMMLALNNSKIDFRYAPLAYPLSESGMFRELGRTHSALQKEEKP
jgi:hypothetical protein